MALIKCPECGKEVSSEASNCPNCGHPINNKAIVSFNNNKTTLMKIVGIICGIFMIVIISFTIFNVSKKSKTIYDEIIDCTLEMQELHGELSLIIATVFCKDETQYCIIYFDGTGENWRLGSTYVIYQTKKGKETIVRDPSLDLSPLNKEFIELIRLSAESDCDELKKEEKIITYEQYLNFEDGYVEVDMRELRDKFSERK